MLYSRTCTVFLTQNYCCFFPSILVIVPRFCRCSLHVRITALPPFLSLSSSFQLQSCCTNYFKVIRALIAGRCFSGGQVPGGASPVTHSIPALCSVPPNPPPRASPSFAARGSPVALPRFNTTESLQVLSCSSAGNAEPANSDYWFTATPLLKHALGPMARRLLALRKKQLKY